MDAVTRDNEVTGEVIILRLYVSGMAPKSMEAIANVKRICDEHSGYCFDLEIVDIYKNPEAAAREQIICSPSLIKESPSPRRVLIGTLSDAVKVKRAIGISG